MQIITINQSCKVIIWLVLVMLALCFTATALAAAETAPNTNSQDQAIDKALIASLDAATAGPAVIELLDEATITLPKDFIFIPRKQAAELLAASGNTPSPTFLGLIMPQDSAFHWFVPVDFVKSGYINDERRQQWQAQDLLTSLQQRTEQSNKVRAEQGFPTIKITGWQQEPVYQDRQHQLLWSLQGEDSAAYRFVNYNIDVLGRDGYFEFTLLSQNQTLKASKQEAEQIISSLRFKDGKRYEDFISGTDPVAKFDLVALVIGEEAAAKSGWKSLLPWLLALATLAGITIIGYIRVR